MTPSDTLSHPFPEQTGDAGSRRSAAGELRETPDSAPVEYRTATDLAAALVARKISSLELVENAIAYIEAVDEKINAVVVRDFDRARDAARLADAKLHRGARAPLLGIPITVKEHFHVAGLQTTWGNPAYHEWRSNIDALAVQRLKAAGAVLLGKTNVPNQNGDWQSYNDIYGTTNNPWNPAFTPGGSSGGGAAALAAGYVPLELGWDGGGSLRTPAHFCGVFSHKASLNLVPLRGLSPPDAPIVPRRDEGAAIGPMARGAIDLELALSVVAGPDELSDGVGYNLSLPPARHAQLADFRVLMIDQHPLCPTSDSIRIALNDMGDRLSKAGCTVLRHSPKLPDLALTSQVFEKLSFAKRSAKLLPEERTEIERRARELAPHDHSLVACMLRGYLISHAEWVALCQLRDDLRARWQALFEDVDVVLCPPFSVQTFKHDHSPMLSRKIEINGTSRHYRCDLHAWAGIANMIGLPSTTMPIAESNGLPIGMQIMGGFLEDRTTLGFAALVELDFGGFRPPCCSPTRRNS
ncbi:amidase [Mesorhizobium albiziae]|uniref:Amidase n=1 Tax=Neomesorhizobium albiziae TaxID=335020 RepID=A0A1I4FQA1_9HYPH|nr:amidase [Mesorhizobium albiziae]GLS33079.1 amidase [Mesorhizobium albiziae]SFL20005.1 amidase [Mesorhizobium albiziae]